MSLDFPNQKGVRQDTGKTFGFSNIFGIMDLTEFTCPSCGAPLTIRNQAAKTLTCSHCGSIIDLTSPQYEFIQPEKIVAQPVSALKLGLQGALGKPEPLSVEIVGRVRYEYREAYQESFWDEWLLLTADGQTMWLQEDQWEFSLFRLFAPDTPFNPAEAPDVIVTDGCYWAVNDRGKAKVAFVEGELTWKAVLDEWSDYLEAESGAEVLSVDWTEEEITFYRGGKLTAEEVYAAFNLGSPPREEVEEALEAKEEDEEEEGPEEEVESTLAATSGRLLKGPAFWILAVFSVLFFLGGCLADSMGHRVIPKEGRVFDPNGAGVFGPYDLRKTGVHKLTVFAQVPNGVVLPVDVDFLDEEHNPVSLALDCDFWDESGYDDEGYWHETHSRETHRFVLKEKGTYYVEVNSGGREQTASVGVDLWEGAFFPKPFWTFGWLSLIYPGFVLVFWLVTHGKGD
ncbi:MAG: DUF4178 domain-containing protein [Armatimonadetes bacterium]|nr:DUF4178 domain-containing protein [Armatimonadota bacterium]